MLLALAQKLDAAGLRPLVAGLATLAYPNQRFRVDELGRWVNQQPECTIVSRSIHTQRFARFAHWASHHWLYRYQLRPGDIVLDVGAGLGEEAVVFSRQVGPTGQIYSVEAHPDTFGCLERTISLSGLSNVTPIHCALSDSDGQALIGDDGYLGNSILRGGQIPVVQRSLSSLTRELGIQRIDFLRMNIEGAEKLAVQGMQGVEITHLCISCHDFCGLPSKQEVCQKLTELGYNISTRGPEPDAPWIGDYVYADAPNSQRRTLGHEPF